MARACWSNFRSSSNIADVAGDGMIEIKFKFGDAVRLKSGGPRMLVSDPMADWRIGNKVQCDWLDDEGKNQSHDFDWKMLEPA